MSWERFKVAMAAIVSELVPNRAFYAPVKYTLTKANGDGKFSAKPASRIDGLKIYPEITDASIIGIHSSNAATTLTAGTTILVGFLEGDPTQPYLVDVLEKPNKLVTETTADFQITVGGILKIAGAASFVARSDYVDARNTTIQSTFDAHIHPTPWGPSGPPTSPIGSLATVAATKTKTD
jgi:hypothetical protein